MDLAIGWVLGDEFGHECLEIDALLGLGGLAANEAGGDFERREQVDRAMPFVGAFEALNNLAFSTYPLARSSAWIVGFSSTLKTSACSGGLR